MWDGLKAVCVQLPVGATLTNGSLTLAPASSTAPVPLSTVETISLASLIPATTSSITYTTLKTPLSGVVFYWFNSSNLFLSSSGVIPFSGNPITFSLPTGWLVGDTITIAYKYQ
jgi:hypothetical protein